MYTAHTSALLFKDNLLGSQIPTWAFTLACTSDRFWSRRRDTKTVMSSANTETLTVRGPAKGTPRRSGFAHSSLSLRSRGSKARKERRGDKGHPCRNDCSIANAPRTPSVYLHHCLKVVVHHANPSTELRLESDSLQNRCQKPMVNPIESLGLI